MELSDSGAPYYRFLVDDCHIECKVKAERTMVTYLGNMLKSEVKVDEECLVKNFMRKERLKRQKIAKSSICFEFQVVVAVVGFKWHRRGNAKNAD